MTKVELSFPARGLELEARGSTGLILCRGDMRTLVNTHPQENTASTLTPEVGTAS